MKKLTTQDFINKSKEIHGDKYDYSLTEYNGSVKKVKIICKKHGVFYQQACHHMQGYQCKKCSIKQIKTTNDFINKSKEIHGDKYDYSLSEYAGVNVKIKIICIKHGIFYKTYANHIRGKQGCPFCSKENKKKKIVKTHFEKCNCEKCKQKSFLKNKIFFEKSKKIHGDKYDYSLSFFSKSKEKITIICPTHGKFEQLAKSHLQGYGCKKCCGEKQSIRQTLTQHEFLQQAKHIHKNKFNYSLCKYKDHKTPVIIICPIHGKFEQKPMFHLARKKSGGCKLCGINLIANGVTLTTKEFIKKAKIVHKNKYDYSLSQYKNAKHNIIIKCPKHGIFYQKASSHLNGRGCQICGKSLSKPESQWLDMLKVPRKNRQIKISIGKKYFKVDGYNYETKTIYEFYGDFWHGNMDVFPSNHINKLNKQTIKQLYEKTMEREKILKENGYNLVTIWENDFKKIIKQNKINTKV